MTRCQNASRKLVDELVVVAGDVNDLGLLAAFAEDFLDEHVVVVAPEPAELQLPAVNEIADDVEIFAVHHAQKFQQLRDAGVLGAEMCPKSRPSGRQSARPQS
jgi:hypothetical protein